MIKPNDPRKLAEDILARSVCRVKVGAAIADSSGRILSWGWNSVSSGFGIHAEIHAIRRCNRDRLRGATIYVASQRKRNGKVVLSKPCDECRPVLDKWDLTIVYRDANGSWVME